MSDKQIQSLDDIVFEHKNKNYGAYRLRSNERGYLTKAFFIGTTIFVIFILIIYFYNNWQTKKGTIDKAVNVELKNIDSPKKEDDVVEVKPEEPKPAPPQQDEVAQIKMVMPEPKKVVVKEETVPQVKETENKAIGLENKEGRGTGDAAIAHGPKNDVPPAPPVAAPPVVNDNKIFDGDVEQEAQYPGGIESLRNFVASRIEYPSRALDRNTEGRVMIKFVVERDGNVSQVTIIKDIGDGCGAEAVRVLKQTKKWKPALVNGKAVRSIFRFPVVFRLPPQ